MQLQHLLSYVRRAIQDYLALGHNKDDINETLLMSLFYEGRIHTMAPVTYMNQVDLHIIPPLIYAPEKDIRSFVKKEGLPVVKSPCPMDGQTKRQTTKELIVSLQRDIPKLIEHLFDSVQRSTIEGWNTKEVK